MLFEVECSTCHYSSNGIPNLCLLAETELLSFLTDHGLNPPVPETEVLPDIDVPMLVCAGTDEEWRSVPVVKRTADLVPEARFEPFEESGHCPTVEEPERFNQVRSDFVERL